MLLASMQQAEATKAEPVFVAPPQKLISFLLSFWAILETTKWCKIKTLECIYFYSLYPCSPRLHEIGTSCLIVLDSECFVASRQWPFFFLLPLKDDRQGRDHMYCMKTNMCHFFWESINTALSVLFATETCYNNMI